MDPENVEACGAKASSTASVATAAGRDPTERRGIATLAWEERDSYAWLLEAVALGGGAAALMALFGLPPVDLHSPVHYLGLMDPLCGMTRAVRLLALGDIRGAIRYNPGSLAIALGAILIIVRSAIGTLSGQWLVIVITHRRIVFGVAILSVALLWVNQQLHADLLLGV